MTTVTVKVMGKPAQVIEDFDGATVADVLAELELDGKYTINVGGQPGDERTALSEGAYIVLAPSVKGAIDADEEDLSAEEEELIDELVHELEEEAQAEGEIMDANDSQVVG